MRRFRLAAAFALSLFCLPAYAATGNVLVPGSSDASATPANPASGGQDQPLLPGPNSSAKMTPLPSYAKSSGFALTPGGLPTIPSSLSPTAAQIREAMPTHVVKMLATDPATAPVNMDLPESIQISVADQYVWGPNDIIAINRALGIPADQVANYCHIGVVGLISSDTGIYVFDTGPSLTQASARYDGKVSGIDVMARAMCDLVPLPEHIGYVLQMGNKYTVYLTQVNCPAPPDNTKELVFQYTGNSDGQCVYK